VCGTSYATALVSGLVAAMLAIDPDRVPSERGYELDHPDVGRGVRVDMRKAIELALDSRRRRQAARHRPRPPYAGTGLRAPARSSRATR
jgi:hypothetical protein